MRSIGSRLKSPAGIFMLVAAAIGLYYLLTEHLTHFTQALPYMILLACPLMHVFGHKHGHAGHDHQGPGTSAPAGPAAQ